MASVHQSCTNIERMAEAASVDELGLRLIEIYQRVLNIHVKCNRLHFDYEIETQSAP